MVFSQGVPKDLIDPSILYDNQREKAYLKAFWSDAFFSYLYKTLKTILLCRTVNKKE